jgi:uncharacterized OB-fold protein
MMISFLKDLKVPGPIPTDISRPFWAAAANGQFKLQHCLACERWVFYPRALCPHCWSEKLEWRDASGRGWVKTFSVVHKPGHPGWNVVAPYPVALIELEEGPTMLSLLVGTKPDRVNVGMAVRVRITEVGAHRLACFEPAPSTDGATS